MDRNQALKIALRLSNNPHDDDAVNDITRVLLASSVAGMPYEIVNATLDTLRSEYDQITPRLLAHTCHTRPAVPRRPSLPAPEDESGVALRPIYFPPSSGREPFPVAEPSERERERMRVFYASALLPASVVPRPDLGIRPSHIAQASARRERAIEELEEGLRQVSEQTEELTRDEREIVRDAERRLEALRQTMGTGSSEALTPTRRTLHRKLVELGVSMSREGRLPCHGCGKRVLDERDIDGAVSRLLDEGARGLREKIVYCEDCRTGAWTARQAPPSDWLDPEVGLPPDELERLIALEKRGR